MSLQDGSEDVAIQPLDEEEVRQMDSKEKCGRCSAAGAMCFGHWRKRQTVLLRGKAWRGLHGQCFISCAAMTSRRWRQRSAQRSTTTTCPGDRERF